MNEILKEGDSRLAQRLQREVKGAVLFDAASRGRYATDASIYQIAPLGVVVPETVDDIRAAMAIAREEGVPVLPRGAGTSQGGQAVNRALSIDCTKHMRRILKIDPEAKSALVEPGIVLAQLNNALRPQGLFFPVDPSTQARCTIGGMTANNSCGSKSIRYGLMADNVRAIDGILADGTQHRFGPQTNAETDRKIVELYARLHALGAAEADEIAERFPSVLRRVGGYNIDVLTPAARAADRDNMARLLVGSEGTLAFFRSIELKLSPIKPRKIVGICQFPTFREAMETTREIVKLDPEAVELMDRNMIDLGRQIAIYRPIIDRMLKGEPDSLLIVEFHGHEDAPLMAKLHELELLMADLGFPGAVVSATDPAFQAEVAAVREAGLNIMMSMKGDAKPVSFIEDCAVGLDDLADYTDGLNEVFEKHGTKATWYAHASVGCLHVRPVLNMKDEGDVKRMRAVAEEAFALVRHYKGSHSGEHGDGIVRSEFHESMYGGRIVRAFESVKDAFDPTGMMNPGRVVRAPKMDDRSLFRYAPGYAPVNDFTPKLDWSDNVGELGGLMGAVEMCNNNGVCRIFDFGVMCPSWRATRDEQHLTRGRANTLRLALTGQLGRDAMASDQVADAMKLCVSCKACKRECPTGVDMAKMKIEATAAHAERHGIPLRERTIAALPSYAPLAAAFAPLANAAQAMAKGILGFADRPLPSFRSDYFRDDEVKAGEGRRGEVVLFADTFNRWFEPDNLRAAIKVLSAAGYRVKMPSARVCCGRTYLSAGMVDKAREVARETTKALAGGATVVGLEPSCVMTLRDEFRSLLGAKAADDLAGRTLLLAELLARDKVELPLGAGPKVAHVHGHCHQKAFNAFTPTLAALKQVPGLDAKPINSSCCGMAGAFGYQAETQVASRAMAELSLVPAVKAAGAEDAVVADGFSCRHQIKDLAGRRAVHSVRILEQALLVRGHDGQAQRHT
jgi:FAD/FMN-containing dehydrogenase/Fe-S oxidoreductase